LLVGGTTGERPGSREPTSPCAVTMGFYVGIAPKVKRSTFIYRHLHEHDQQRFTIRSGVLTGNDIRWRSASSDSPLPEQTDFGLRSLQL